MQAGTLTSDNIAKGMGSTRKQRNEETASDFEMLNQEKK